MEKCKLAAKRPSMPSPTFNPGFRISTLDVVVLFLGAAFAANIGAVRPWFGVAIAFPIAHFFVFCNVVRMARPLELTWAVTFVALAAMTVVFEAWSWPVTLGLSLIVSTALVTVELRKPSYHGAFWQQINPGLPQWWEANIAANPPEIC
jgi:hypothetical protein